MRLFQKELRFSMFRVMVKSGFRVLWVSLRIFFGTVNLMKIFTIAALRILKILYCFLNLERGIDLSRPQLVFSKPVSGYEEINSHIVGVSYKLAIVT